MYYYFVSFAYKGFFGNAKVVLKNKIRNIEDIKEVQRLIEENEKVLDEGVVVLFFQLLKRGRFLDIFK